MTQIRIGVILTYLSIFLSNGVSLVFTPYMLGKLGKSEYGLYALVGSLMAYLTLLTFGIGGALVRYIARYRGAGEKEKEENLLAMALLVHLLIGGLILAAGSVLWVYIPDLFQKLTEEELLKTRVMFAILTVSTAISIPGMVFFTIQEAYERFTFSRAWNIVRYVLRIVMVVALLYWGYKAIAIVLVDAFLTIIAMLLNIGYVFGVMKIRIRFHGFDTPLMKEILTFSFWLFLSAIVTQLYWSLGQMILAITSGSQAIAVFAVSVQMASYFLALSSAMSGIFTPRAAMMDVQGVDEEMTTDLMIKIGRNLLLIMGLAYVGFFSLGRMFLNNWLGSDYDSVWLLTLIMATPLMLVLSQNFGVSVIQAKNKVRVRAIMLLAIAVFSAVIGYFLSLKFGALGVAWGTSLALFLGSGLAMNLYYYFGMGLNIPRFFREVWGAMLLPLLASCVIGVLINTQLPGDNWVAFIWKGGLLSLVYVGLMWLFGMLKEEKEMFISLLRRKKIF